MKEEITIDFNIYRKVSTELTLSDFVFLQCVYLKQYYIMQSLVDFGDVTPEYFESELWTKSTGDSMEEIFLRQKALDLFQSKDEQSVEEWINDWVQLFPSGIKSGGYYIRGNKEDCLKKMIKFLKVRRYNKEQVFQATKNYIARKAKENYSYMMKAEYFIEKDGISALASEISNMGEVVKEVSINKML